MPGDPLPWTGENPPLDPSPGPLPQPKLTCLGSAVILRRHPAGRRGGYEMSGNIAGASKRRCRRHAFMAFAD
jgi:hypothetical protein